MSFDSSQPAILNCVNPEFHVIKRAPCHTPIDLKIFLQCLIVSMNKYTKFYLNRITGSTFSRPPILPNLQTDSTDVLTDMTLWGVNWGNVL